jgi:ketosteroid isomerase-like protein
MQLGKWGHLTSHVEIVRRGYEAFAAHNPSPVLEFLDDNVEWVVPAELPYGGTYVGRDGVVQMLMALAPHFAEQGVEPRRFIDAGDIVVAEGRHFGRPAGGDEFSSGFATVFEFQHGKITRVREYVDATIVLAVRAAASQAG